MDFFNCLCLSYTQLQLSDSISPNSVLRCYLHTFYSAYVKVISNITGDCSIKVNTVT